MDSAQGLSTPGPQDAGVREAYAKAAPLQLGRRGWGARLPSRLPATGRGGVEDEVGAASVACFPRAGQAFLTS